MTDKFKARVREEMALTGESYQAVVNRWRKAQPPIETLNVVLEPTYRVAILTSPPTTKLQQLYYRALPNGYEVVVLPMTFGKARVCYGEVDSLCYLDAYCYPTHESAIAAASTWNGEGDAPVGWTRHPATGRYREDGDPSKEVRR